MSADKVGGCRRLIQGNSRLIFRKNERTNIFGFRCACKLFQRCHRLLEKACQAVLRKKGGLKLRDTLTGGVNGYLYTKWLRIVCFSSRYKDFWIGKSFIV